MTGELGFTAQDFRDWRAEQAVGNEPKPIKLTPNEVRVLAALASVGAHSDFAYLSFKEVGARVHLTRSAIRRACRSLARKGLAKFAPGLWTEDDRPGGSGYAATREGLQRADQKLVDRIVKRRAGHW